MSAPTSPTTSSPPLSPLPSPPEKPEHNKEKSGTRQQSPVTIDKDVSSPGNVAKKRHLSVDDDEKDDSMPPKRRRYSMDQQVCSIRSYKCQRRQFNIIEEDMKVVEDGRWLNSSLVDFTVAHASNVYVEHRHGRPDELGLITSETWREYNETKTLQLSEEHAANLVSYPFIAMPMNIRDNHWVLAILAYVNPSVLGDAQGTPNTCTSVLVFDSLGSGSKALRKPLEAFVGLLLSRSGLTEDTDPVIVFAAPKEVSAQKNLDDCGLYPAHFLRLFLADPHHWTAHFTGIDTSDALGEWQMELGKDARDRLRRLLRAYGLITSWNRRKSV